MRIASILLVGYLSVLLISSCGLDSVSIPDTSQITLDNRLIRFDQMIARLDTNDLANEVTTLNRDMPEFYSVFFRNVLPFEATSEEAFLDNLKGYLSDERIKDLQDTTAMIHKDFESETLPKLNGSLKLMKHYFPDYVAPNLYTFTSEYTYQQFVFKDGDRDGVGIGLDLFLGSSYPYKEIDPNNPAFSQYLTRTFDKAHLPKKIMQLLVDDVVGRPNGSRLLDNMITNGKRLYILEKVLPTTPDSIIHEYTSNQMKWMKENEAAMWSFYFDENLFYESNTMKINKYINPSPNSPGMPDAAPGRTANYLGLQIVKAYLKRNPETTIQELIDIKDAQKIMDGSRFKPKRR